MSSTSDLGQDVSQNYLREVWLGKKRLRVGVPLADPMDSLLTGHGSNFATEVETPARTSLSAPTTEEEAVAIVETYIKDISYLQHFPNAAIGMSIMKKVVLHILPIIKRHSWTIGHLSEVYPEHGEMYGCNSNTGETILICIRKFNAKGKFQKFEDIMSTVLHELCHNVICHHDRDFWTLYYNITTEYGMKQPERLKAFRRAYKHPGQRRFWDEIAMSVGGVKVLIDTETFYDHFSAYTNHDNYSHEIVQFPRKYHPSLIVRLIQLAKGLDPADSDTYLSVPNVTDYYSHEGRFLRFNDDYQTLDEDAGRVLDLYLDLYKAGKELGWHTSSRDWLMKRLYHLLNWGSGVDHGSYIWPELDSEEERTLHVAESTGRIYLETTLEDQCLRDVAIEVLADMILSIGDADCLSDLKVLQALYDNVPEIARDLRALFQKDNMVTMVSSTTGFMF